MPLYELRTYTLAPGAQPQYVKLAAEVGRKIRGDNYGKLEGYWTTEFGTLNQVVHLWSYESFAERERLRGELQRNESWTKEYLPQTRPMMVAQENKLLTPVVPVTPPSDTGNVYELRWYRTHVGRAGEWVSLFKDILPFRDRYTRRVGLWQTEVAQLNEVVHMWVYKDLNDRAKARSTFAQQPEWQAFAAKSAPLLAHMQSIVLLPTAHSPMK